MSHVAAFLFISLAMSAILSALREGAPREIARGTASLFAMMVGSIAGLGLLIHAIDAWL